MTWTVARHPSGMWAVCANGEPVALYSRHDNAAAQATAMNRRKG